MQLVPCCECVCTRVPARACVCSHVHTLTGVCIPAPMCISARVHTQIHVCACVRKCAQARVCRCVCKHTQACAHTHTCAHHVHTHTKHTPILQPASTPTCPEPTRERARPCTPAQGHACERSIRPSEAAAAGGEPGRRGGRGGQALAGAGSGEEEEEEGSAAQTVRRQQTPANSSGHTMANTGGEPRPPSAQPIASDCGSCQEASKPAGPATGTVTGDGGLYPPRAVFLLSSSSFCTRDMEWGR